MSNLSASSVTRYNVLAQVASGIVFMAFAAVAPAAARSINGSVILGNVFLDYNANGQRDNRTGLPGPLIEPGVPGLTITAFGPNNAVIAFASTDAAGNFTLPVAAGTSVRVEVSGLPPGLQPGPVGPGSSTTVSFVTSPATVNVGLVSPTDYCNDDPTLAVPCYVNGDPLGGGTAGGQPTLVAFHYNLPLLDNPQKTSLANAVDIGATWGVAYQRSTKTLFASAVMKRHVGFGPLGTGGIYAIDLSVSGTPKVSNFLDVGSLGIFTGADPHSGLPPDAATLNADPLAWDPPGKISLGGLDISDDERTLWFVNLADRTAYGLDIKSKTLGKSFPIVPALTALYGTCTNGEYRPWAVRVHDGADLSRRRLLRRARAQPARPQFRRPLARLRGDARSRQRRLPAGHRLPDGYQRLS